MQHNDSPESFHRQNANSFDEQLHIPQIIIEERISFTSDDCSEDNLPPEQDINDHNHIHPPMYNQKRKSGEILDPAHFARFAKRRSNGSFSDEAKNFTKRASQLIIEVPVAGLKKIQKTTGANSLGRETQHFIGITTLHGPLRMYRGKSHSRVFWGIMMVLSAIMLTYQAITLFQMYTSKPTTSEVNFLISENGMDFPMVTVCNFNPIRKSYIKALNKTGDFTEIMLDYLIQYNYEVHTLFSSGEPRMLDKGQTELNAYQLKYPSFSVQKFFTEGGFECRELLKICSFAGVEFDCCANTDVITTDLGKCFLINTTSLPDSSMRRQTAAGVNSGLQLIMDTNLEEQFDGTGMEPQPIFTNSLENGFRYYIHQSDTIPHIVSEGISVSPGATVYSALTVSNYDLLDQHGWGNCTKIWPKKFNTRLPYSAANCAALCKAEFFEKNCGCTPFVYNVDNARATCLPNETYTCITKHASKYTASGSLSISLPQCQECNIECNSWNYAAFNSYGQGFSNGAVKWIQMKNTTSSAAHIRSNYVAVNVFYRDMTYMKYIQQKGISLTEILSDIGGNMGMWLGMSVLTALEVIIFLSKISWIFISRKRREYMFQKKQQEQNKEKELENTMTQLRTITNLNDDDEEQATALERLKRRIEHKLNHKPGRMNRITPIAPVFAVAHPEQKKSKKSTVKRRDTCEEEKEHSNRENESTQQRRKFMESFYNNALYGDGRADDSAEDESMQLPGTSNGGGQNEVLQREDRSVIQLKIDLDPLEEALKFDDNHQARRRTISIVPTSLEYVNREERARTRSIAVERKPSFYVNLEDDVFQ